MRGVVVFQRRAAKALGQPFGARIDAKSGQKGPLGGEMMRGPAPRKRLKVNMRGQIGAARCSQGIGESVVLQGLQRITF